ncbi:MAG: DUF3021 domain-containing protein [Ruminococcus sp.]|nr:DUF3021 domain-containing protein [Ruminococcus sp.]MBQ2972518.1 DUF3021 domain-containing protein [Ruminococcus sp.]
MKLKDLLIAILTGIGIGIPITIICMVCIGGWNEVIKEFLVWTVASALFGVLSVVTFSNEKMNLILATVLHCIGCLFITVGACWVIGYADSVFEILPSVAPVFVIVYAAIYSISVISMRKNAKKANDALSKK